MDIRLHVKTQPDISQWGQNTEDFGASAYQVVRSESFRFRQIWHGEAPKNTGRFAGGLRVLTFNRGSTVGFEGESTHPLSGWIQEGTRPHVIQAKRPGGMLRFYWANGPRGAGVYFFRSVNHPGTKPNQFTKRAIQQWLPGAGIAFRTAGLRFTLKHFHGNKVTALSA